MTQSADMEEISSSDPHKLKEEGNVYFKNGQWDLAVSCYSKAIASTKEDSKEKAILLKNRAAAYLKKNNFNEAVKDCTDSLNITPNDPKALYRRCQAYESLGRCEDAYVDARAVHSVDPTNAAIQPVLTRLHAQVQEKLRINAQTGNKLQSMTDIVFDFAADKEKRETAVNNLIVLARERAGSDMMLKTGVVTKIQRLIKVEKNDEIVVGCIRAIGELCKHNPVQTSKVIHEIGIPWLVDLCVGGIGQGLGKHERRINACQHCLQIILDSFSGLKIAVSGGKNEKKPDAKLIEEYKKEIDTLLMCISMATTARLASGDGRDALILLLTQNVHYSVLDWGLQLVRNGGLQRLLEVSSELEEYTYESKMEVTPSTKALVAACLSRIYESMYYDAAREEYLKAVESFITDKLRSPDLESKVRVTVALTSLLLGPLEVGNTILAREGVIEMILVMANSDDLLQQKVACECIIAGASKKDKVKTIIDQGVHILKKLYQSKDDSIRVRALVGLCKLGSSGGTDASIRPFAEGSNNKLAEACRRFLISAQKDQDIRRWAAEGLSYLTLDADVKEKLIEDKPAIQALVDLGKSGNRSCVYGVVTTFVNLVNAYDKKEAPTPELVKLAEFAKHHIPQEHELDDPDFVAKRTDVLGKAGVASALVSLSNTESAPCKELICRVFNALCNQQDLRGIVVQQGGAKALLTMALTTDPHENTEQGRRCASQALARIGITIDPTVAFPGQRCAEVVRPLLNLLHVDFTGLENFEALMALCNLAGVSETVRMRIMKEQGLQKIETYLYENHTLLRRAATQVMTNLMLSPEVIKAYEGDNDRLKFMVLLCTEATQVIVDPEEKARREAKRKERQEARRKQEEEKRKKEEEELRKMEELRKKRQQEKMKMMEEERRIVEVDDNGEEIKEEEEGKKEEEEGKKEEEVGKEGEEKDGDGEKKAEEEEEDDYEDEEEADFDTVMAAAGALAILLSNSSKCCKKMIKQCPRWVEALQALLALPVPGFQHRGAAMVEAMMRSSKEVAESIIETNLLEILMMLSRVDGDEYVKIRNLASLALKSAEEMKLIKKPGEGDDSE
ncbi:protein unc-45 homolog B [Hetaerina americana]|uniref:protein unc-45 homolog B n=1 Tax=Hetaerina americana TaxID=62018 RepID=UPI003A7F428B